MKPRPKAMVNATQIVHTLRHLEKPEYICLRQEGREYLACFSDGDSAFQFREELGLVEYVDIHPLRLADAPFDHFWLDGEMIGKSVLVDANSHS
jgi:hypothetical protein